MPQIHSTAQRHQGEIPSQDRSLMQHVILTTKDVILTQDRNLIQDGIPTQERIVTRHKILTQEACLARTKNLAWSSFLKTKVASLKRVLPKQVHQLQIR